MLVIFPLVIVSDPGLTTIFSSGFLFDMEDCHLEMPFTVSALLCQGFHPTKSHLGRQWSWEQVVENKKCLMQTFWH